MPEDTAFGSSLWLVPEPRCADRLAGIIGELSEAWETSRFAPHVTLLSILKRAEAELLTASERLAAKLDPIRLRALGIDWSDQFFQAFYVVVEREPALLRAHVAAAEAFGRSPDPDYFPHLSLAYGELTDAQRREARARIEADFGPCRAGRLDVVRTTGPPESWETLAKFPLSPTGGEGEPRPRIRLTRLR